MPQINKILEQPNVLDGVAAHKVKIIGGFTIEGSLQQDVEISFNPEYKKLSELMVIPIQTLETAASNIAGGQLFSGITTEKYYTGSSYISVSITMRVIDTDGSGKPLKYAAALAAAAQPVKIGDVAFKKAQARLKEKIIATQKAAGKFVNQAKELYTNATKEKGLGGTLLDIFSGNNTDVNEAVAALPGKIGDSLMEWITNTPSADIESFLKQAAKLYEKNRSMQVEISNYLCFKEMVLESASQTFSQQQGFAGPLFADFTMQFSTRRVPNSESVAGYYKTDATYNSRVTYEGPTS